MTGFGPRVGRQAKVRRKHGSTLWVSDGSQANTGEASYGGTEQDQLGVLEGFLFCIKIDCFGRIYLVFII